MSVSEDERSITQRVGESPRFDVGKLKDVRPRDLAIRFAAGATTSVVAALLTLGLGPRVGGVMLAFPAILAASLTLIEEKEDSAEAREDARGAIVGACALTLFAVVAAVTFGHLAGGLVLALATIVWALVAVIGYLVLWWR